MAKAEPKKDAVDETITVPQSRISTQGFRHAEDPEKVEKETKRHEGFVKARTENRKKVIKAAAKKTPVEVRRDYLRAKLAIVRNRNLTHHYTREQVQVMIKELDRINSSPDTWKHGCVRAKKARSVDDKLDAAMAGKAVSQTS